MKFDVFHYRTNQEDPDKWYLEIVANNIDAESAKEAAEKACQESRSLSSHVYVVNCKYAYDFNVERKEIYEATPMEMTRSIL
jgi:hypothetical protein